MQLTYKHPLAGLPGGARSMGGAAGGVQALAEV